MPMPSQPISLPPTLRRKSLQLPPAIVTADPAFYEHSLLLSFGLEDRCADLIVNLVRNRGTYDAENGVFIGFPKFSGIPLAGGSSILEAVMSAFPDARDLPYFPSFGVITCDCAIRVGARVSDAVRDFRSFYVALSRAAKLPVSSKAYRNPQYFTRDLRKR